MNDSIPADSPTSKDKAEPRASADTGSSGAASENARALDAVDKDRSDEANPALLTADLHATSKSLATNRADLSVDPYPIWWRGTGTPPPATWAYTFEEFPVTTRVMLGRLPLQCSSLESVDRRPPDRRSLNSSLICCPTQTAFPDSSRPD